MVMGENKFYCVKLNNINEFDCLKAFFAKGHPDIKWAYRGQADSEWRLRPNLEREVKPLPADNLEAYLSADNEKHILEIEANMIQRFKEQFAIISESDGHRYSYYGCSDGNAIAPYLSLMQHYEIPTRLLDFSHSLEVAFYFASEERCECSGDNDRSVWALRLDLLEHWAEDYKKQLQKTTRCSLESLSLRFADMVLRDAKQQVALRKRVLPLLSEKNSPRMMAQQGLFIMPIIPGHFEVDLAETLGNNFNQYGDGKHVPRLAICDIMKLSPKQIAEIAVLKIEYGDSINADVKTLLKLKKITYETMFPEMQCIKCRIMREFFPRQDYVFSCK